jgi:hypothetical protein
MQADFRLPVNALDRTADLINAVAYVDADGDLIAFGHESDHDHWVAVGAEVRDLVLLELLRERFEGADAPTAELMQWLQEHGIPFEVGSPAGEHRGPARISAKGRRRNGAHGSKPTRAGP